MKKAKYLLMLALLAFCLPFVVNAKEAVNVYIFKGKTCGYCAKALSFFESLAKDSDYKDKFNLVEYEVWYNDANAKLGSDVAAEFDEELDGVPYIVIGDKTFSGYTTSYDDDIKESIDNYYNKDNRKDIVAETISKNSYSGLEAEGNAITTNSSSNEKEKNADTVIAIIIIVVAVVGFGYVIYLSRKDTTPTVSTKKVEKKVEEKVSVEEDNNKEAVTKTEEKKETPKKTVNNNKQSSKKKSNKKNKR